MDETVTLKPGQHVMHDDAIAHAQHAAVQAFLYGQIEWTLTDRLADGQGIGLDHISTDQLVKRVEQARALLAQLPEGDGVARADVERVVGRLTLTIMSRLELFA